MGCPAIHTLACTSSSSPNGFAFEHHLVPTFERIVYEKLGWLGWVPPKFLTNVFDYTLQQ